MKKKISLLLFMALTQIYSIADTPLSTVIDGTTFYFVINEDGETATITNDKGDGVATPNYSYSGDLVIPSTVEYDGKSYKVTRLGDWVFCGTIGEPTLTSVVIPEGVTEIGTQAFFYCTSLTSVAIPESVTDIGVSAFNHCTSLTTVEIPSNSNLTSLEQWTFSCCESLKSFSIPKKVETIGYGAFICCYGLTSVDISEGVKYIGENAFNSCQFLPMVVIPESVTEISNGAFGACFQLGMIYIKGTTRPTIAEDAFAEIPPHPILYVYEGMKSEYLDCVGVFISDESCIKELSADQFPNALPTVTTTTKSVIGYYDLSGRKVSTPKGVTIIRYSDGTSEKILAK